MGAMQFVPGSHRGGVFPHRPLNGDVVLHALTVDVDTSGGVVCPLRAGGATFHHSRTLHATASNSTDRPRLAFPTEFEVAPKRRAVPAKYNWVDEWRAATDRAPAGGYVADGRFVPL
jgi:ectoine hydroxylase-related dioxygenase (phytanoyl-CoA dioxygenase family)